MELTLVPRTLYVLSITCNAGPRLDTKRGGRGVEFSKARIGPSIVYQVRILYPTRPPPHHNSERDTAREHCCVPTFPILCERAKIVTTITTQPPHPLLPLIIPYLPRLLPPASTSLRARFSFVSRRCHLG